MHHIRRTFNSAQIYTDVRSLFPSFCWSMAILWWCDKTTNFCQVVENSIQTRHITFTHTNMYYVLYANDPNSVYFIVEISCTSLSLNAYTIHINTWIHTHIHFPCPNGRRRVNIPNGAYSKISCLYIQYILEWVSFYFCIVAISVIIFVTYKNIVKCV